MLMKTILCSTAFFLSILAAISQSAYKITYNHCFEYDTARVLDMTPLLCKQAILIGNNGASMYSLNKIKGNPPNAKYTDPDYTALADSIAQKKSFSITIKWGIPYDSIGDLLRYDKITDSVLVRKKMSNEYVLTGEQTPKINWIITSDTMRILGYRCLKATCSFRGRRYEVWFTPEIPIADGPWKFKGLPGLVLSVEDDRFQVKINVEKIEYPIQVAVPTFYRVGKVITLKEYFQYANLEDRKQYEARKAIEQAQDGYGMVVTKPRYTHVDQSFEIELKGDD
jgi:GLPGLI family protein